MQTNAVDVILIVIDTGHSRNGVADSTIRTSAPASNDSPPLIIARAYPAKINNKEDEAQQSPSTPNNPFCGAHAHFRLNRPVASVHQATKMRDRSSSPLISSKPPLMAGSRMARALPVSPTCLPNGQGSARFLAFRRTDPAFEPSLYQRQSPPPGNAIFGYGLECRQASL
jgi:hypothetical protein